MNIPKDAVVLIINKLHNIKDNVTLDEVELYYKMHKDEIDKSIKNIRDVRACFVLEAIEKHLNDIMKLLDYLR